MMATLHHALLPRATVIRRALIPLLAAVAATLMLTPAAMGITHTDAQFLSAWYGDGLYASSDQAAIDVGHTIVGYLDDQPTFDGISHLADMIVHSADGDPSSVHFTYHQAGEQIYLSVYYYGAQHLPLLNAYIDNHRDPTAPPLPGAGSPNTTLVAAIQPNVDDLPLPIRVSVTSGPGGLDEQPEA